jgi:hypothetical protein
MAGLVARLVAGLMRDSWAGLCIEWAVPISSERFAGTCVECRNARSAEPLEDLLAGLSVELVAAYVAPPTPAAAAPATAAPAIAALPVPTPAVEWARCGVGPRLCVVDLIDATFWGALMTRDAPEVA